MNLNLSGQAAKADAIRPHLVQFQAEIEKRFAVWQRLSPEKRKQWIQVAEAKDPLFHLFVLIAKYCRKWEVEDVGD